MRIFSVRRGVLLFAAALLCSAARADAPSPEPEKIELRLRLQKGQTFDQVVVMEQKVSQTVNRRQLATALTMRCELHNEVLEVRDDGAMRVRSTFRRVKLTAYLPQYNHHLAPAKIGSYYDSAHPPKVLTPGTEGAAALAGQSLTTTYSPEGKALKIEGVEQLVERILDSAKIPAAQRDHIRAQIRAATGNQVEKQTNIFARFPDHAVGVGESWQSELAAQTLVPITLHTQYTLLARADGVDRIGVTSQIALNEKAKYTRYTLSGKQSGVLSVDEASGLTRSFELHQNVNGKINVLPPGQKASIVPISISSTVRSWTIAPPIDAS
jgi:hypothetical protein